MTKTSMEGEDDWITNEDLYSLSQAKEAHTEERFWNIVRTLGVPALNGAAGMNAFRDDQRDPSPSAVPGSEIWYS